MRKTKLTQEILKDMYCMIYNYNILLVKTLSKFIWFSEKEVVFILNKRIEKRLFHFPLRVPWQMELLVSINFCNTFLIIKKVIYCNNSAW